MSETNGASTKKSAAANRMTHMKFFKLCEELRNRRDVLLTTKPNNRQTAKEMAERLGFPVTPEQIQEAKTATGVAWSSPRCTKAKVAGREERVQRLRTVVAAVRVLYQSLGMTPTDTFEELYQLLNFGKIEAKEHGHD